jgi:hypothetical protein
MANDGLFKRLSQSVPFSDMTRAMMDFPDGMTVRDMLQWAHSDFVPKQVMPEITQAFQRAMDMGRLRSPAAIAPASALASSATMSAMALASQGYKIRQPDIDLLTKPLLRSFESEIIWAANESKKVGQIQPHHLDAEVDVESFWRRLIRAEFRLDACLASGTTEDWHIGAVETLEDGWAARFRIDEWQLSAEVRAPGRVGWQSAFVSNAYQARLDEKAELAAERARERAEDLSGIAL